MTAFEILTIVFYAVVVMIGYLICRGIATVIDNQQEMDSNLRKMDAGLDKRLEDISQQLDNIEDNILDESVGLPAICKKLDELRIVAPELRGILNDLAINSKGHYNELQQLREEIYSKRLLLGLDTKPSPPCYAPHGICTNPQMDCINCPKRSTGGTWSTSTNLNKED